MIGKDSNLVLMPVNNLLAKSFFVPSYQRGYRWTPLQVTELLDDIWEFHTSKQSSKEEFYCLQPIVVAPRGNEWELIDGQQRLTTIFLILQYLKPIVDLLGKDVYKVRYETRKESESFLQNIDLELEGDNIDYYHFCKAYESIETWFNSKDKNTKINFLTTLLNPEEEGLNVKVIWYEVSEEINPVDIFTRINVGKIPLTNAELIRALFLRSSNFNKGNTVSKYIQLQIATEWDIIERKLQNDQFWYFIYNGTKEFETRIEYIFDLMKSKSAEDEDYFTYHAFNRDFQATKGIEDIWLEVKGFFQVFDDWFSSRELYHLVGYLVATESNVAHLKAKSENLSKSEFREFLDSEIRKKVNLQLIELEYRDKQVKNVLLLFNIQTIIQNPNSSIWFPFNKYREESWDIEHIRSVKSDMPLGPKQKQWLLNILEYFTGLGELSEQALMHIQRLDKQNRKIAQSVYDLLSQGKFTADQFSDLYEQVLKHFKEDVEPENINSISNLALLDTTRNRSYKNAVFPVKRKTILQSEAIGSFIPICTKNVFLKAYSDKLENIMFWQEQDSRDYFSAINKVLVNYLPVQEEEYVSTK